MARGGNRLIAAFALASAAGIACGDDSSGEPQGSTQGSSESGDVSTGSAAATGETSTSGVTTQDATTGSEATGDTESSTGEAGCREPGDPDATRYVVVAHPNDADGNPNGSFEVLSLSSDGELSATGQEFTMGRVNFGEIVFTRDGEIGFVAQDGGTVGIFRLLADGTPEVIEPEFSGGFYAEDVVVDPAGDRAWILDAGTVENGGGVYEVEIGCDDAPTELGLAISGSGLRGWAWLADGRAFAGARELPDLGAVDADAFLLAADGLASALGGGDAFGDEEAIVASAAVVANDSLGLVGDNNAFSGLPNRIAVVRLDGDTVTPASTISPIEDPYDMVASPFGDAVLVVSGTGDALVVLDVDPQADPPVSVRGELEYVGAGPLLPGKAVMIERGTLAGRVLVAELSSIRQVQFGRDGHVTDVGSFDLGEGFAASVGAVGVQP